MYPLGAIFEALLGPAASYTFAYRDILKGAANNSIRL